jgi:hypothetical protein
MAAPAKLDKLAIKKALLKEREGLSAVPPSRWRA